MRTAAGSAEVVPFNLCGSLFDKHPFLVNTSRVAHTLVFMSPVQNPSRMLGRFWSMLMRFRRQFWTRSNAVVILISILSLVIICAGIQVSEIWGKAWSNGASGVVIVLTAVTGTIAFFGIPASRKNEARRKTERAISSYVILDSLGASIKPDQKNRVINRMRELAPVALYSEEEIADFLFSADVGERFAALASAQWQWQKDEVHIAMDFRRAKKPNELPKPPQYPDKGYFPQLLEVLSGSWSSFENYHATVAMWSMVDSLESKDRQNLFNRVLNGPLGYTCEKDKWDQFIEYLKDKRKSLGP